MVSIPEGTFQMGSTLNSNEQPLHNITLSSFYIGKYEVTNTDYCEFLNSQGNQTEGGGIWINLTGDAYQGITGNGPYSVIAGYENRPVVYVSWYGAIAYCNWLSTRHGLTSCYGPINNRGNDPSVWRTKNGYRLPTEAEWEYACRAGSNTSYYWGDSINDSYCWYNNNSVNQIHTVGQKRQNTWGIFDISGNVWEWCNDWYDANYYSQSPSNNPVGPVSGSNRVYRGGGWHNSADCCRSAIRYNITPDYHGIALGFRLCRTP